MIKNDVTTNEHRVLTTLLVFTIIYVMARWRSNATRWLYHRTTLCELNSTTDDGRRDTELEKVSNAILMIPYEYKYVRFKYNIGKKLINRK